MLRAHVPLRVPYKNLFCFQELSEIIMLGIALISLLLLNLILKERKHSIVLLYIKRLSLETGQWKTLMNY